MKILHQLYLVLTLAFLLLAWGLVAFNYEHLVGLIPVDFDFYGEPSRWGDKSELLLQQGVHTLVAVALYLIVRREDTLLLSLTASEEQQLLHRSARREMIYRLMPILGLTNVGILLQMLYPNSTFSLWLSLSAKFMILLPIAVYIYQSFRHRS